VAAAIFLARTGKGKKEIKDYIEATFNYDLSATLAEIRPGYGFDETCQGSVPQSVIAFLESSSYEDAVRKTISLGGDSDTQACIARGIAQAFYKTIGDDIIKKTRKILGARLLAIVDAFSAKYGR
jgi:ADP-ribosylglycohydrolase